ncbi:MAG: rhodanese-like domain-containing protein [Actinobacteria bacterium]|nr:rhodanese-like domain-containing protein [Actinomycetota bacterium]
MRPAFACTIVALALLAAGCTRKTSDRDVVFLTPAEAVAKSTEPQGMFSKEPRSVWIDPRTPERYAEEHITGAISLPFPRMSAEAPVMLRGYDRFFVYGSAWDDTIAKAASKRLMELGFDDVYTIKGGLSTWSSEGHPVEVDPAAKAAREAREAAAKPKTLPAKSEPPPPRPAGDRANGGARQTPPL